MNGFLVSKETVVLRRWGKSKQKFGFIKLLLKSYEERSIPDEETISLNYQPDRIFS